MITYKVHTVLCVSAIALAASQSAIGQVREEKSQTADDGSQTRDGNDKGVGVAEIVVTAQRRSESLLKIPIAVTALDSDALVNSGVSNAMELSQVTPGLVVTKGSALVSTFIRGVGTRLAPPGLEPSIATYVDDRYEGTPNATLVQLLDVERVEVVKGPQGVLFGRNATGGAVRIITKNPTDRFEGNALLSYGNYDAKEARGTLNVPVSDTMAARVSGLYIKRDGFLRNLDPNGRAQLDDANLWMVRAKLKWALSSDINTMLTVDYWRENDALGQNNVPLPPFDLNPALAGGALGGTRRGEAATALTGTNRQRQLSGEFRVDAALGDVNLASITTYSRPNAHLVNDVDATSAPITDTYDYHTAQKTWTQEIQLVSDGGGSLDWVIGAYYLSQKGRVAARGFVPIAVSLGAIQNVDTESLAAFGQLTYRFSSDWSVTLGGRYGHERKSLLVENDPGVLNLVDVTRLPYADRTSFSKFTPKAVLQWDYDARGMIYASYSRGIKGGGYSFPAVGQPVLRPEILDSFEIGWKSSLFSNRLTVSSAAFLYKYNDLQVSRTVTLPNGGFSVLTDNAAKSLIKGIEADLKWRPSRAFSLSGGFLYIDGHYQKYPALARVYRIDTPTPGNGLGTTSVQFDASGYDILFTPKFSGYVTGQYTHDLSFGTLDASVTYSYKSGYDFDFIASPRMRALRQQGYGLLAARLSIATRDERYRIALFGNNLANKRYLIDASVNSLGPKGAFGEPRTYGVQVEAKF